MSALGFRGYWPQSLNRHTPKLSGSRAFQCQVTQIRVQKNSWFWGVFLHKIDVTYILKAGMTINLVYLGTLDVHPVTRPSDFCGNELAVLVETLSYGIQGEGRINQESWMKMSNWMWCEVPLGITIYLRATIDTLGINQSWMKNHDWKCPSGCDVRSHKGSQYLRVTQDTPGIIQSRL